MMHRKKSVEEDGFSLLEAVLAISLFSMSMLAATHMAAGVYKTNQVAGHCTAALFLAQNKMEEIKSADFNGVAGGMENNLSAVGASGAGVFDRRVQVSDQAAPRCKIITVKVSWGSDYLHQVVLSSIKAP